MFDGGGVTTKNMPRCLIKIDASTVVGPRSRFTPRSSLSPAEKNNTSWMHRLFWFTRMRCPGTNLPRSCFRQIWWIFELTRRLLNFVRQFS
ncbi:hypothetical protein ANTRET_LOCUS6470 [Anthophora retusa]